VNLEDAAGQSVCLLAQGQMTRPVCALMGFATIKRQSASGAERHPFFVAGSDCTALWIEGGEKFSIEVPDGKNEGHLEAVIDLVWPSAFGALDEFG